MAKVMSHKNNKKESGFTLIELLAVIIIIGVLAAVAIPMFSAQKGRAQDGKTVSDVRNIVTATETYLADKSNTLASVSGATVEVRTSPGTYYDVLGNTPTGGYCIVAYNALGKKYNSASAQLTYDSTGGGLYKYGSSCQGLVSGGAVTGKTSDGSTFTGSPASNTGGTSGSGTGSNGGAGTGSGGTGSGTGVGSDTVTSTIPVASYGGNTGVGSATTVPAVSNVSYSCSSGTLSVTNCNIPSSTRPADVASGYTSEARTSSVKISDGYLSCPSGGIPGSSLCFYGYLYSNDYYYGTWVPAQYSTSTYYVDVPYSYNTCNGAGKSLNGNNCVVPAKTVPATKTTTYSCPAGYTLAGTVCNKN